MESDFCRRESESYFAGAAGAAGAAGTFTGAGAAEFGAGAAF